MTTYRLLKKDVSSVEALYDIFHEDVRKQIYFMISNSYNVLNIVEDLSQETWLRVHKSYAAVPDDCFIRAWLMTVAQNITIDHIRKIKSRSKHTSMISIESFEDIESSCASHENIEDNVETQEIVRKVLKRMTPENAQIISLYAQGFKTRDIQEILNKQNSGVKMAILRSRRKFQQLYQEYKKDY